MLVLSLLVVAIGLRPLQLVNVSVIFGMTIMPLTYYPILKVAADKNIMGKHANNRVVTIIGTIFLVLITVAGVAAAPLMIVTHSGRP